MKNIARITNATTGRTSSWDTTGRNADSWRIKAGETVVLADIKGAGCITHIWMTQRNHYRECLLRFTWDGAKNPSVVVPLGDFFCLGNSFVNSFESIFFTASTNSNNKIDTGCALNCYIPMPFRKGAKIELINQSREEHNQYFYIDYETYPDGLPDESVGYFHAEFRRENPFGGWADEITVNTREADIANKGRLAWDNNYVILDTAGRGHYIGCNISVSNFQGTWWGEGDDMIWVDGYKWPPDIHGTGSEDYLNQAWGMQDNAFLHNGSSVFEGNTKPSTATGSWDRRLGGYQTSYVFHAENPVRFQKEIKVTIEHGHGNHLRNEMSSVAYWYAERPTKVAKIPPVAKRMRVMQDQNGNWVYDKANQSTSREIRPNAEMKKMKAQWRKKR